MTTFYQEGYSEPGLTTELPDDNQLAELLRTKFRGSSKDFSYHISILQSIGLRGGDRILDYGANWGYLSWQLREAGFQTVAYEVSVPRAKFGEKIGLAVHTDLTAVGQDFDFVYSCHVLEHVPDPASSLREQLALVRPGGFVAGHTPNGSRAYRLRNSAGFRRSWGLVHPVLLSAEFLMEVAGDRPFLMTSDDRPDQVGTWDRTGQDLRDVSGEGFFFVIRQPS